MIELLSPVGDFECLKAAVQNGADSVYFGSGSFNARASAENFSGESLVSAINYAKLRGVSTHLTLNTLIKNDEFSDALDLAKKAYENGIDAIIVQDLGLATYLIKHFPLLPIHASTQMTVHNLEGVLALEKLGFQRAVLSRELSLQEIEYICSNSNIEIETFIHGALCISYSGQCLFSSMIGGRSGNRGKCAQPCRLPYELVKNDGTSNKTLSKGYLLSPRDLCGLEYIPLLINSGVKCFKIEGRMKTPEYVAITTRIYRKYIDLALSDNEYIIEETDKKELLQAFNRGGFSSGYLEETPNQNLVFKEKQNNMGLYLGNISNFNSSKGLITMKLLENLNIGDTVSFENENTKYNISELLIHSKNAPNAKIGQEVTIGRMKGNIKIGDKIYKIADKELTLSALASFKGENKKIPLHCDITVQKNKPIELNVSTTFNNENIKIKVVSDTYPEDAKNAPITNEKISSQIAKTTDTPFEFKEIIIDLGENLFVPSIRVINELRRNALEQVENKILSLFKKIAKKDEVVTTYLETNTIKNVSTKVSLLLNILNTDYQYSELKNIDRIYIPLKYFTIKECEKTIKNIVASFETYIYLPSIIKENYRNLIFSNIEHAISNFDIKGFVLSNISQIYIPKLFKKQYPNKDFRYVSNYTLNVYNNTSIQQLIDVGINGITVSPELDKENIQNIINRCNYESELIIYGNIPLMTSNYCLHGQTNKCFPTCGSNCKSKSNYYLKDRLGYNFKILADNVQTITTIYNSKTLSIPVQDLNIDWLRIDILDENIDEINHIIQTVKSGGKLEGSQYTNGNLSRNV